MNASTGEPTNDGFAVVTRKKKTRKNQKYLVKVKTTADHLEQLEVFRHELSTSAIFQEVQKSLVLSGALVEEKLGSEDGSSSQQITTSQSCLITGLRCLALGSPTESPIAMYQLALLQLILELLKLPAEAVSMYDPVFSDADLSLFGELGYRVSETYPITSELDQISNQLANTTIRDPVDPTPSTASASAGTSPEPGVLVYMIHSPPSLTESILSTLSASEPGVRKSDYRLFIGNILPNYANHLLAADLESKYPEINRAINSCEFVNCNTAGMGLNDKAAKGWLTNIEQRHNHDKDDDLQTKDNAKQELEDAEGQRLEKKWVIYEIIEKLSKDKPWSTAFNDTAVYWTRQ